MWEYHQNIYWLQTFQHSAECWNVIFLQNFNWNTKIPPWRDFHNFSANRYLLRLVRESISMCTNIPADCIALLGIGVLPINRDSTAGIITILLIRFPWQDADFASNTLDYYQFSLERRCFRAWKTRTFAKNWSKESTVYEKCKLCC